LLTWLGGGLFVPKGSYGAPLSFIEPKILVYRELLSDKEGAALVAIAVIAVVQLSWL
jgi:hypothetical protein